MDIRKYRDFMAYITMAVIALDGLYVIFSLVAWLFSVQLSDAHVFWIALANVVAWLASLSDNGEGL